MTKYYKLWPGGNTTALVTGHDFPRSEYARIANEIIKADPEIEQVGFMEKPEGTADTRLQMMGGEFCGNATRSAAFFWLAQNGMLPTASAKKTVKIEASGARETLTVEVSENSADLELPGDFFVSISKVDEGFKVDLEGIRHIIIEGSPENYDTATLIKKYGDNLPAVGIIYSNFQNHTVVTQPFIWVRETNTLIAETGCASGSIAASIAGHHQHNGRNFEIVQPSGESYQVELKEENGKFTAIVLKGSVKQIGEGQI